MVHGKSSILTFASIALLASCSTTKPLAKTDPALQGLTEEQQKWKHGHDNYLTSANRKSTNYVNPDVMKTATPENVTLKIGLKDQRGILLTDNTNVGMDFRVSTGKSSHPTPKGNFKITEKDIDHTSSKYGRYVSSSGATLNSDVNTHKDSKPAGARYVGAPMPYFCRLTGDGVGLHVGYVPNYPASHGCIRVPKAIMPQIYKVVKLGTPVTVTDYAVQKPTASEPTELASTTTEKPKKGLGGLFSRKSAAKTAATEQEPSKTPVNEDEPAEG